MLVALIYGSFIIVPSITEIILASRLIKENSIIMGACGVIQTFLSIYLSFRLGTVINDFNGITPDKCSKLCGEIWYFSPIDWRGLFSVGYVIITLPHWVVNIFISWVVGSSGMPLYAYLIIYLPLIVFMPAWVVVIAYKKAVHLEDDIKQTYSKLQNDIEPVISS